MITKPEDMTPERTTDVLHQNGLSKETRVSMVDVILRTDLPLSTVCRLGISYEGPVDESYPRSLFLKLPRKLDERTRVGDVNDHAEVEFYRTIAPRMSSPPILRCYDAVYSEDTSHILLDDLTETHSQPDEELAPSEDMSRRAVEALAQAHSFGWNTPPQQKFDLQQFIENLNRTVPEFLKVAELTSAQRDAYGRMLASADKVWGRLARTDHLTVTHGDMHWWNFLYPKDPSKHSVHIIDWHLWHMDLGARDLGFLLALGGFAEPRPSIEEELLHVYHEALGVPDYSWEMLMEDYRWSAIRNLNIPVIFRQQGKHYSTWQTALRRAYEAYERLGCGELI
jgi:thiamine kinase-like enzyme